MQGELDFTKEPESEIKGCGLEKGAVLERRDGVHEIKRRSDEAEKWMLEWPG